VVKTNAVRVLDGLGIKYELREYKVDPDHLSAEPVAAKIGYHQSSSSRPLPYGGTGMEPI
jgi:prolyl-tRNA editing enzyme YbaK/EbsC (Cys-tRNA(Pro) deacylase)